MQYKRKNWEPLSLLGSTGSIGVQSLDVCRNLDIPVELLTAGSNVKRLEEQIREFRPKAAVITDEKYYKALKTSVADLDTELLTGSDGICEAVERYSSGTVINSIVGIAGLRPSLTALASGRQLALANKESLVTGGELVMGLAREKGIRILPIDSEHSAIFQCLLAGRREDLRQVILTASGGPFAGKMQEELRDVTAEQALRHPNWSMGAKITVDSATLMNKGLELIEAMWLFDLAPDQIQVVVHRQSVLHSAVEFLDGSVIAQMGVPDMRTAIQYALTFPERIPVGGERLDLFRLGGLTFERPDPDTFTCLDTCIRAAKAGGLAPCVANGANEQAVELFLRGDIGFLRLGELVAEAVSMVRPPEGMGLSQIEEADALAREFVLSKIGCETR